MTRSDKISTNILFIIATITTYGGQDGLIIIPPCSVCYWSNRHQIYLQIHPLHQLFVSNSLSVCWSVCPRNLKFLELVKILGTNEISPLQGLEGPEILEYARLGLQCRTPLRSYLLSLHLSPYPLVLFRWGLFLLLLLLLLLSFLSQAKVKSTSSPRPKTGVRQKFV